MTTKEWAKSMREVCDVLDTLEVATVERNAVGNLALIRNKEQIGYIEVWRPSVWADNRAFFDYVTGFRIENG